MTGSGLEKTGMLKTKESSLRFEKRFVTLGPVKKKDADRHIQPRLR